MSSRSRIPWQRGRARATRAQVLKADHPRRIDLIIDYFGERRKAAAGRPGIGQPWRAVPVF